MGPAKFTFENNEERKWIEKVKGILIGYDYGECYRIWCEQEKKLIASRDVIFEEKVIHNKIVTISTEIDFRDKFFKH